MIALPFAEKFAATWAEWLEYRKQKRLPKYVDVGLKRTFSMIVKLSNGNEDIAVAMIEQSMAENWQGIFQLKNNNNATTTNTRRQATTDFLRHAEQVAAAYGTKNSNLN